ncbi:hypothetical protein JZ751_024947 [Albula glossodonta]|uniref:RGS domain-containing protein n=1 Tax=Albula glossodonta TaxID=121402 RepID=A0A8T2PMP0_9TELE|nr:hypothetical protein JZ751_024947 [Albula glossodonta]
MCKGLAALPATCLKSAKDMKHRIGFLLQKPDFNPDQRAGGRERRINPADLLKCSESLEHLLNNDVNPSKTAVTPPGLSLVPSDWLCLPLADVAESQCKAPHLQQLAVFPLSRWLTLCSHAPDVGRSYSLALRQASAMRAFAAFLKSEFSQENIEFWMACEKYKKTASPKEVAAKAMEIYDQYVAAGSPNEVNLDSATREETKRNLETPSLSSFDEAQRKIFLLMEKDSYKRFLKSRLFQEMVPQPTVNLPCGMEKKGRRNTSEFALAIPQCA